MESGQKWAASGLWHLTTQKAHSPTHSQWFGDEATGTYGAGGTAPLGVRGTLQPKASGRVTGSLTSPQITVTGGSSVTLSFWHWRHVEHYSKGGYDKTYVQVRYSNTGWQQVWYQDSKTPSQKQWEQVTVNLNVPSGASWLQVRFVFDSVDGYANNYPGWFIDDVRVEGTGVGEAAASPLSQDVPRIEVRPNPFRDYCTFTVFGATVDAFTVRIYDLLGRKVDELYVEHRDSVDWDGGRLRNGAYIYVAHVLSGGEAYLFRGFVYIKR